LRYAVIADIHANLHAFEAVLDDMKTQSIDRVLCLGDIVGYGANPVECLEIVRGFDAPLVVAGNHDWAVVGQVSVEYFNADARESVDWTRAQLSDEDVEYLKALELLEIDSNITIVHSNTFDPSYFDYIQTLYDVELTFQHMATRVGFVGHSHVPLMITDENDYECFLNEQHHMQPGVRLVVNVGSVGQPRDMDTRACYAVYDDEHADVCLRRVDYDVHAAAACIQEAGLPPTNAARLLLGR